MVNTPQNGRIHASVGDRAVQRERSLGEHIFIWIAWVLAAAFWGASLTTMVQIFRAAGKSASETVGAPGVPGGSAYLVLVVVAFLVMAFALAYAEIRASMSRP